MGGAVSHGEDNEELIDNLVDADYIKTHPVEKAFRLVDRANYYLDGFRDTAYKDMAWKNGNLHLSAPCIYAEVLECLKLQPGYSFLNLGSGTGYLSTVAGLLLGTYGINHGVEQHADVVEYANERLVEFLKNSAAVDVADFCRPCFVVGNCLQLEPSCSVQAYDRIYCGAAVPPEHLGYIRNLVKVGGVVVLPSGDQLLQITRVKEDAWETKSVLPVSFATLVEPSSEERAGGQLVVLPDRVPLKLQEICRYTIRSVLRDRVQEENPDFNMRSVLSRKRRRRSSGGRTNSGDSSGSRVESAAASRRRRRFVQRILIPVFQGESDDDADEDEAPPLRQEPDVNREQDATRKEDSDDGTSTAATTNRRRTRHPLVSVGSAGGFLRMERLRWDRLSVAGNSRGPAAGDEDIVVREEEIQPSEDDSDEENANGSDVYRLPVDEDIRDSLDFEQQLLLFGNTNTDGHGHTNEDATERRLDAPGSNEAEGGASKILESSDDGGERTMGVAQSSNEGRSGAGLAIGGTTSFPAGESSKRCHSESEVPEAEARRKRAAASAGPPARLSWRDMMSDGDSDDSDGESDAQREQRRRSRQENVAMQNRFSKAMSAKIFLLPVPDSVKTYLSYHRN